MFLLYHKKDKACPETVKIGGDLYYINADFRNILRILDMLGDGNITAGKKISKLTEWFFRDDFTAGNAAAEAFIKFIGGAFDGEENGREPQFCFNFDAGEIYAGFLGEYNIDLTGIDFLHWYKFKILLGNLPPDSAFKKKIGLRFLDLTQDGGRRYSELARAKEAVQLPAKEKIAEETEETEELEELEELEEFNKKWGKAGD